ncbi:MAG TPA: TolC family protein, partial [Gemmatimonadales bacterium]|nr:TolC family protein [Gemmatimonadales bacterium]
MSFVKFALVAAALAGVADLAGAQTPAPDTIDLARAIALARVANPMLAARDAEVRAAGARIAPAGALPDPRLTLGAMNYMLPSLSARMDPLSMNQITLTQMVPINGMLGLRRAAARHDSTRTAHLREATSLMIESEVRARYWELYHTDRSLEIMDRTLAVMRELSNVARTMYAVGSTVQSDVLRSQVAITRLQQEIAEMQLQRFRVATAFNALLGRPGEAPVVLPPPAAHAEHGTPMHALELPEPPSLDSLMELAAERNPEILAMQAGLDRAASEARLARRMIVPDLELGVGYGQRPGDNDMLSLMIGASLPVFARS